MNWQRPRPRVFLLISLLLIILFASAPNAGAVVGQSNGGYTLTWYTVGGGGTMSASSGTYTLSGTIGQPDAGTQSSGGYTLNGGFWYNLIDQIYQYYFPFIRK